MIRVIFARHITVILGTMALGALSLNTVALGAERASAAGYIAEAHAGASAAKAVRRVGGRITHEMT
jgi:hypothetical protein